MGSNRARHPLHIALFLYLLEKEKFKLVFESLFFENSCNNRLIRQVLFFVMHFEFRNYYSFDIENCSCILMLMPLSQKV
ncbi:MAG: hypothetical protein CMI63_18100 [Parvularcula sp.]|nr:hypothetical protein [Parvularcula sp.]